MNGEVACKYVKPVPGLMTIITMLNYFKPEPVSPPTRIPINVQTKEGRGFGRLPSFFFPPFLFIFLMFFFWWLC